MHPEHFAGARRLSSASPAVRALQHPLPPPPLTRSNSTQLQRSPNLKLNDSFIVDLLPLNAGKRDRVEVRERTVHSHWS